MAVTYKTTILGFGNHAAIEIPDEILTKLGANRRAPLKITLNGYTYQSTATAMDGKCLVVFPTRNRQASGVNSGDTLDVTLELDSGYRNVDIPTELLERLKQSGLTQIFHDLTYSKRKEFARQIAEAKSPETKSRRLEKILQSLQQK